MSSDKLIDNYGRSFSYLRLSLTEACNFRCTYCLPNGYCKPQESIKPLSILEIKNLTSAINELGFDKIRLTGGEPTLRKDFIKIAETISDFNNIKKIAVTTNGHSLKKLIIPLKSTKLKYINVSIDTLNPQRFYQLTGHNCLNSILDSVDEALDNGFTVKTNAVMLKESTLDDLEKFLQWIKYRPVSIRFIELMQTGTNKELFKNSFLSAELLVNKLIELGFKPNQNEKSDGPAKVFSHKEFEGTIGVIAPYSKDFCSSCNRLRINAYGALRLCLFGNGNYSLRNFLQSSNDKEPLKKQFIQILNLKPASHLLQKEDYGDNQTLSAIGG
ncbi:MAG: GTP 3',8-cyclase MoaA [Bacteriovoracaceae bacterium]